MVISSLNVDSMQKTTQGIFVYLAFLSRKQIQCMESIVCEKL